MTAAQHHVELAREAAAMRPHAGRWRAFQAVFAEGWHCGDCRHCEHVGSGRARHRHCLASRASQCPGVAS